MVTHTHTHKVLEGRTFIGMLLTGIYKAQKQAACRDAVHWFTKTLNKLHVRMVVSGKWLKEQQRKQCDGIMCTSASDQQRLLCGSITLLVSLLFKPVTTDH